MLLVWVVDVLVLDPLLHRPNALCWLTGAALAFGVVSLDEGDEPEAQSDASPQPFFGKGCGGGGGVSGILSVGNGGRDSPRIDELPSADEDGSPIAFSAMTKDHEDWLVSHIAHNQMSRARG